MSTSSKIKSLLYQLYPKGRAFNFIPNGWADLFHTGLSNALGSAYNDSNSVIDDFLLPDNENFTLEDAEVWEDRLAIPVSTGATLDQRKAAIIRKWRYPGTAKARAHRLFIQGQLQEAGFDVYVYENRVSDGAGGITTIDPYGFFGFQHGEFEHGEEEHGAFGAELIANYIDYARDESFDLNGQYETTFFIASEDFGTVDSLGVVTPDYTKTSSQIRANVDLVRREELRALLLRLKPAKTIGFLLVNWI